MIDLQPLGDRAFLARFLDAIEARRWADAVLARGWRGVVEVTVAYASAAVFVDPDQGDPAELEPRLREVEPASGDRPPGRLIRLPVLYDGDDLGDVATRVGLTEAEVVARHAGQDYAVFAIGFLPGFPYSGYLPEPLSGLPRRSSPRSRVLAGSVAIAGRQTGVYPAESPGGWHLLGRTPCRIVDLAQGHFPIRAGDTLRFVPINPTEFDARRGELLSTDGLAGSSSSKA